MQQKDRKPSQGLGGSDVGVLRVGGWFQAGRIKDSEGLMGVMDETKMLEVLDEGKEQVGQVKSAVVTNVRLPTLLYPNWFLKQCVLTLGQKNGRL